MTRFPTAHRMVTVDQQSGWVCSVCGRSNAPSVKECNHVPLVVVNGGICFIGASEKPIDGNDIEVHTKMDEAI